MLANESRDLAVRELVYCLRFGDAAFELALFNALGEFALGFAWSDHQGQRSISHTFTGTEKAAAAWTVPTGRDVKTRWVEFEPIPAR